LRPTNTVLYCAIDNLISVTGKPLTGFPEFLDALAHSMTPCIWITSRTRAQIDFALRKFGHSAPFIAEGGSGVYIPEDYFHLKPARTIRLARFTCIPVGSPQPDASEALDSVAAETGISVVPLRALSPRELTQNTGLPPREAELLRTRDFDELFFFAGATDSDIQKFTLAARGKKLLLRSRGTFWSLSVGASLSTCIRELSKLFERALRAKPFNVAMATTEEAGELFPFAQRPILLTDRTSANDPALSQIHPTTKSLPLFSSDTWESALETVLAKHH